MFYHTKNEMQQKAIDQYFDQVLSPAQEQEFLISLASNESMRELFRAEVLLLQATALTKKRSRVPEHVTAALFSALGFQETKENGAPIALSRITSPAAFLLPFLFTGLLSFGVGYFTSKWSEPQKERVAAQELSPANTINNTRAEVSNHHQLEPQQLVQQPQTRKRLSHTPEKVVVAVPIDTSTRSGESAKSLHVKLKVKPWSDSTSVHTPASNEH